MYLRSITLKNTGPIQELNLNLPFEDDRPKPLILVGKNGSGKSTLISFIVNALVGIKQHVYEDIEVEKGKVYRLRSPLGINGNSNFFYARLNFDHGISLVEWQLDKPKQQFTEQDGLQAIDPTWDQIPAPETSFYQLVFGELTQPHQLEEHLEKNCILFFPADRFEPPDWLNTENLSSELKLPEPSRIKGRTTRRIFSRNRLKPTLEWLNSILFDMMVNEHKPVNLPVGNDGQQILARIAAPGRAHVVFNAVTAILQKVLCYEPNDALQLGIGDRRSRIIEAKVLRDGKSIRSIRDLMSLSAGESALFCMFASIIRDADISAMQFESPAQITGIVVIDEADLHLHLSLQYEVLPRLIALFPKIQFIVSVHAPLVALGLEKTLGADKFEIREMPSGVIVAPESYSEFLTAFDVFASTKKFQTEVLAKINESALPALLVEGKTDATLIATAWGKLHPDTPIPYKPIPCGIEPNPEDRNGGAEVLRRCLEFLSIVSDRQITAVFDNDSLGNEQFNGVNKVAFDTGNDSAHKRHKQKDIHAILLPAPPGRETFVSSSRMTNRYLSIEHYFDDALLLTHGLKGEPIVADSQVFEIDASSAKKIAFAESAKTFDPKEFGSFVLLFERLEDVMS